MTDDTPSGDDGGFVCPPSEAEEFIRRAKSAGLAESIHIEFVTSEEGFRYPPRDPSQPKPTGEPFVVLDPESQTVKPATILGKPVVYKDLGVGEGDIVLASLEEFYGAAGVLFTSGGVDTADNGDGTFTHTFEIPQGPLPKEITISGPATFSPEFEQWLGRAKNGGVFSVSATIKYDDIRRMWVQLGKPRPRPSYQHPLLDIARLLKTIKRKWALRAFIHSLRGFGGWLQIYYPPAPLPHALVYKSNPTRREAKSKRIHARIAKATTRRMA